MKGVKFEMEDRRSIKRILSRMQLNIWGWPTLVFCLFSWAWMFFFEVTVDKNSDYVVGPGSVREALMVEVLGACLVAYFWILFYRYRKIKGVGVSKRTKLLLIVFSGFYVLGLILVIIAACIKS